MTAARPHADGELAGLRADFPQWGILQISPDWFVAVRGKTTAFSAANGRRLRELIEQWEAARWTARS